jgi:hypothetical protein
MCMLGCTAGRMSGEGGYTPAIQSGYEEEAEGWGADDPSSPRHSTLGQSCETRHHACMYATPPPSPTHPYRQHSHQHAWCLRFSPRQSHL